MNTAAVIISLSSIAFLFAIFFVMVFTNLLEWAMDKIEGNWENGPSFRESLKRR